MLTRANGVHCEVARSHLRDIGPVHGLGTRHFSHTHIFGIISGISDIGMGI